MTILQTENSNSIKDRFKSHHVEWWGSLSLLTTLPLPTFPPSLLQWYRLVVQCYNFYPHPHPTNHRSHNKKKHGKKKQKCILTKVNKNDKFLHSIKKSEKGRIFHIERFLRSSGIQRSKRPFVWVIGGNLVCFLFVSFCKGKKGQKFPINFYPKTLTNRLT